MSKLINCPIWATSAIELTSSDYDRKVVDSSRAGGKYSTTGIAESILEKADNVLKRKLTMWLVEQRQLGTSIPEINSDTIEDSKRKRVISVYDRAIAVLKYFGNRSMSLGDPISFDHEVSNFNENSLTQEQKAYLEVLAHSACMCINELSFHLNYLMMQGLIDYANCTCIVTVDGYRKLAELEETNPESQTAFVAMWFSVEMDTARERVKEAIELAGYKPILIDEKDHINRIDDEIISEIRRCRFLVADLTHGRDGARGGVYYEAGFAYGLGIQVIYTCRKDKLCKLHFDIRQYNHLVWENPEELRKRLEKRITKVIGDGPLKTVN